MAKRLHLIKNQQTKVAMNVENNDRALRAYRIKKVFRLLLKIKDIDETETELRRWWANHSRIKTFKELYPRSNAT